jgi:hypothetical protein
MKTTLIMIAFLSSSERRNMVQSQGRFQWYIVRTFERYGSLARESFASSAATPTLRAPMKRRRWKEQQQRRGWLLWEQWSLSELTDWCVFATLSTLERHCACDVRATSLYAVAS